MTSSCAFFSWTLSSLSSMGIGGIEPGALVAAAAWAPAWPAAAKPRKRASNIARWGKVIFIWRVVRSNPARQASTFLAAIVCPQTSFLRKSRFSGFASGPGESSMKFPMDRERGRLAALSLQATRMPLLMLRPRHSNPKNAISASAFRHSLGNFCPSDLNFGNNVPNLCVTDSVQNGKICN